MDPARGSARRSVGLSTSSASSAARAAVSPNADTQRLTSHSGCDVSSASRTIGRFPPGESTMPGRSSSAATRLRTAFTSPAAFGTYARIEATASPTAAWAGPGP